MATHMANKGLMGIGTLIIFIAIIIVAAVASVVLISTSGSLEQQALTTGKGTQEEVSTGARAFSVIASDASDVRTVDHFEMMLRLSSGSEAIKFSNTIITIDTYNSSSELVFGEVVNSSNTSSDNSSNTSSGTYDVQYLTTALAYEGGYFNIGDVVKIIFDTGFPIGEREVVRIQLIPEAGQLTHLEFITPTAMTRKRIFVYP
ncbi:archaellin/type IV pilin N-terminal domain-containing protein [Candidatus Altiarchaeota archaeon]